MAANALLQRQEAVTLAKQAAALPAFADQRTIARTLSINPRTLRRLIVTKRFPPADLTLSKTCLRWRLATVESWLEQHANGEGAR